MRTSAVRKQPQNGSDTPEPTCTFGEVRWQCAACRYHVSLTAGTILHKTKTPLTVWFWAAYPTVTDTRGMSALLLRRQLGLRRYETPWMLPSWLCHGQRGHEPLHDAEGQSGHRAALWPQRQCLDGQPGAAKA
jgi:hypothetical protein